MSHLAPTRRRASLAAGTAALALALTGCATGGPSAEPTPTAAPAASTAGIASGSASAASGPTDPASAAAAQVAAARASALAEGTRRPEPREALETAGPGIKDGAATAGWQATAAAKNNTVSVMNCTKDVLDQRTLDAVATHMPAIGSIGFVEQFASHDSTHEFMTCVYSGHSKRSPGMPLVEVQYQHNMDGERLEWCRPEPAAMADEYRFDEKTGKGLLALLRPGMVGGQDGAPLLPQRTGWACTEDGTQMVSITFGSMKGFGDANKGLAAVEDSPAAQSTTLVTQARDHLADTVLKDPSHYQEIIQKSSPFFLDAQMDEKTLQAAQAIPTGRSDPDDLSDQSTIDRPEGAPGPVAPGQPPRPFQGAAAVAAASESAAAASSSAAAASEYAASESGSEESGSEESGSPESGSPQPTPASAAPSPSSTD